MKKRKKLYLILIICFTILIPSTLVYSALSKKASIQEELLDSKLSSPIQVKDEKLREYLSKANNVQ